MVYNSAVLDVHMAREPVFGTQSIHHQFCRGAAESIRFSAIEEVRSSFEEQLVVAEPLDPPGPIMTEADIDLRGDLQESDNIAFPDIVNRTDIVPIVGQTLRMTMLILSAVVDTRDAGDAVGSVADDVCSAEIVDVGSEPAAVEELLEIAGAFVVAADHKRQNGGLLFAAVVAVEVSK